MTSFASSSEEEKAAAASTTVLKIILQDDEEDVDVDEVSLLRHSAIEQWIDQEDGRLILQSLQYLDVVTLIQKVKPVNKQWNRLCTKTIDNKCGDDKKKFETRNELFQEVNKYSPGTYDDNTMQCNSKDAEEIASTYGYPIGKWDVSNINDFSLIFKHKYRFNEPIGSWDVSNVTDMRFMFYYCYSFNQDLSSWDVSNVTDMRWMFNSARSFNRPIGSWDVSNATTMYEMFYGAELFNQDISSWDVSSVTDMSHMFCDARTFNQDLASWDVSNVNDFFAMFRNCAVDAKRLPWFQAQSI